MTATLFTDSELVDAIQPIYQLNWANVAEENGESFSGCKLEDVCPLGNPDKLLPIARKWLEAIERAHPYLCPALLSADVSPGKLSDALYYVFMSYLGHGVGWEDFADENEIDLTLDRIPYGEDCDVRELVEEDYASQ